MTSTSDKIHCETSKIISSSIRLRLLYSVGQQKSKSLVKEYKFVKKLSPSKILQTDFFSVFIFLNYFSQFKTNYNLFII